MRSENRAKDDDLKDDLRKQIQAKIQIEKDKAATESQDKLREAQLHSEIMLENMKAEIRHKIELQHQQRINKIQFQSYK